MVPLTKPELYLLCFLQYSGYLTDIFLLIGPVFALFHYSAIQQHYLATLTYLPLPVV